MGKVKLETSDLDNVTDGGSDSGKGHFLASNSRQLKQGSEPQGVNNQEQNWLVSFDSETYEGHWMDQSNQSDPQKQDGSDVEQSPIVPIETNGTKQDKTPNLNSKKPYNLYLPPSHDSHIAKCMNKDRLIHQSLELEFYTIIDTERDDIFYFCHTCRRYGAKATGKRFIAGDYVFQGVSSKIMASRKTYYLRRHLDSKQHLEALQRHGMSDEVEMVSPNLPIKKEAKLSDGDMQRAVEYLMDNGHSYNEMSKLQTLLQILFKIQPNRIGNELYCNQNFVHFAMSNYMSTRNEMAESFRAVDKNTKQVKCHSITLGKFTAEHDSTRQIISSTFIGKDGDIQEALIGCKIITDKSGKGCLDNFYESITDLINPSNIISISSGNELLFNENDCLNKIIKRDDRFSPKIIHISDICHDLKRLLSDFQPPWLKSLLEKVEQIAFNFSIEPELNQILSEIGSNELIFYPYDQTVLKYSENILKKLHFILINVEFFIKHLPNIFERNISNSKLTLIYKWIIDPNFILYIKIAHLVFSTLAWFEKCTQAKNFNAIDLINATKKLETEFNSLLDTIPTQCNEFFEAGYIIYNCMLFNRQYQSHMRYNVTEINCKDIVNSYLTWINILLENYKNYLNIPDVINKITQFFNNCDPIVKKELFGYLFNNLNINFYSCGITCQGPNQCKCVDIEIAEFSKDLSGVIIGREINYNKIFSHYLSEDSSSNLKITNILRIMEASLLLKPSYACIDRVSCVISNLVKDQNQLPNISQIDHKDSYKPSNTNQIDLKDQNKELNTSHISPSDMVELRIFCKLNSNMSSINVEEAKQESNKQWFMEEIEKVKYKGNKKQNLKRSSTEDGRQVKRKNKND